MIGGKRALASKLIAIGGAAALFAAVVALVKRSGEEPDEPGSASTAPPKSGIPELATYTVGYILALALTIVAFSLVHWHWASASTAIGIVFGLALVQIVVHFRCFLHVTLRGPARDDLQLILFSTLIILLMVCGTLVVLFNLRMRMM